MPAHNALSITHHFASLTDPRVDRTKEHKLLDILTIAICAIICGADGWTDIALFGQRKQEWLRTFLELPNGIPSHDTFGRVFAALDPTQFETCFLRWIQAISDLLPGQVVAIDGKQLRRSHDWSAGRGAIHMVSAWASVRSRSMTSQTRSPPSRSCCRPWLWRAASSRLMPWAAKKRLPPRLWTREQTMS